MGHRQRQRILLSAILAMTIASKAFAQQRAAPPMPETPAQTEAVQRAQPSDVPHFFDYLLNQKETEASKLWAPAMSGDKAALARLTALANTGNADAQKYLAYMYEKGDGVPKDAVQSMNWWRKSAEEGHAEAQYLLALKFSLGDGVIKDSATAYMWFNLAAAQGHEEAKSLRDLLEKSMTPLQIAEAQKLSREWKPKPAK